MMFSAQKPGEKPNAHQLQANKHVRGSSPPPIFGDESNRFHRRGDSLPDVPLPPERLSRTRESKEKKE